MLNRWKPSVSGSRSKAREPGSLLPLGEDRGAGRNNPGMKLVADALDDFHYDVLQAASIIMNGSCCSACACGAATRTLEKGRPVNLNVNLEEDIPALLTSLQLSDRVSETIRQRVQERMQKRKASAP